MGIHKIFEPYKEMFFPIDETYRASIDKLIHEGNLDDKLKDKEILHGNRMGSDTEEECD